MSRRLLAAAIAALTVIAAAILAVVTNVVTGKSLPSWADWLTAGNHAWWSLGGLIVLIAVLSVVASLLGQEPDRRRNSAAAPAAAWIDPQAPLPHEIRMDPPQDDDFYRVDDVRQISYLCRFNSAVLLVTGRAEGAQASKTPRAISVGATIRRWNRSRTRTARSSPGSMWAATTAFSSDGATNRRITWVDFSPNAAPGMQVCTCSSMGSWWPQGSTAFCRRCVLVADTAQRLDRLPSLCVSSI